MDGVYKGYLLCNEFNIENKLFKCVTSQTETDNHGPNKQLICN